MAFQNNEHSENSPTAGNLLPKNAYELKFKVRYDVPFPYYDDDIVVNRGTVDIKSNDLGESANASTPSDHSSHRKISSKSLPANSTQFTHDNIILEKFLRSQINNSTPTYDCDCENCVNMNSVISTNQYVSSSKCDDLYGRSAKSSPLEKTFVDTNSIFTQDEEEFDEGKRMEKTFSCHLQEVEMILERISSSTANFNHSENPTIPYSAGEKLNTTRKKGVAGRWRPSKVNNFETSGLAKGVVGGRGVFESLVTSMTLATMSEKKRSSNEPKFSSVPRSQSMRYHGQQSKPKTTMFPDEENDEGCSNITRLNGCSPANTTGVSPARSWKSSSRKMESPPNEFRHRTTSVPSRQNRRSQSMRIPNSKAHAPIDRRPTQFQFGTKNQMRSSDDGDFERMRTFTIDPNKPGIIINRGDSFRRRSNTGNSTKGKSQNDQSIEIASDALSHPQLLPIDSNLSNNQGGQIRKSSSPISPAANLETFLTPPESLSPLNGQLPRGVKKYDIIVVGLDGVGKTAMINQFMTSEYCNPFQADNVESVPLENTVSVQLDGEESRLSFMEIDNQKNAIWLTLNGDGYLVVYSIDDALSFRNAKKLVYELRQRTSSTDKPIILVANKIDLERKRQVTADDGRSLAKDHDCKFVEITVALGHHVDELLVGILAQVKQSAALLNLEQSANDDEGEVFLNDDNRPYRPISTSLGHRPVTTGEGGGFRSSPGRQNQSIRRSSTKRRKRLSTSKTPEENSSISPPTSCSNLTAVGHRIVQKMFGRRRSSRSLEDLLTLA